MSPRSKTTRQTPATGPQGSEVHDNLLEVITRARPDLRKSERRVADAILDDPEHALSLTLAALSKLAGVSEPTVIRFSALIGCDG